MSPMTDSPLLAFHHVGVVTPDIDASAALYRVLGYAISATFHNPVQSAAIALCSRPGEPLVELIAPADPSSPAAGWLRRLRAGAYHTCYEVADLPAAVRRLRDLNFVALSEPVPAVAFEGRRVVFLWSDHMGLVELVEQAAPGEAP